MCPLSTYHTSLGTNKKRRLQITPLLRDASSKENLFPSRKRQKLTPSFLQWPPWNDPHDSDFELSSRIIKEIMNNININKNTPRPMYKAKSLIRRMYLTLNLLVSSPDINNYNNSLPSTYRFLNPKETAHSFVYPASLFLFLHRDIWLPGAWAIGARQCRIWHFLVGFCSAGCRRGRRSRALYKIAFFMHFSVCDRIPITQVGNISIGSSYAYFFCTL